MSKVVVANIEIRSQIREVYPSDEPYEDIENSIEMDLLDFLEERGCYNNTVHVDIIKEIEDKD